MISAGYSCLLFFFQAEDGIRDYKVTGVQTCALPILKDLPLEFAVNLDYTGPTSGSLLQGLNALGSDVDAVVVMLGDMVRVSGETLAMLRSEERRVGKECRSGWRGCSEKEEKRNGSRV